MDGIDVGDDDNDEIDDDDDNDHDTDDGNDDNVNENNNTSNKDGSDSIFFHRDREMLTMLVMIVMKNMTTIPAYSAAPDVAMPIWVKRIREGGAGRQPALAFEASPSGTGVKLATMGTCEHQPESS